ncbi:MAG: hypoxanthine-guanine phosphoribosyltransferase [Methylococcaceae bacterium]|nr:hypoxanthine-guanine phosphoribosyltransferase [Methylococcaceae bacterium]
MNPLDEVRQVEAQADQLYSDDQVRQSIERVAQAVTATLGETTPLVLTVLNGGIPFAGILLMRLPFPLQLDSIQATRYRGSTSGNEIAWLHRPQTPIAGRTVLIVDDVLDEGVTLAEIVRYCREQGAAAVYTAVLVDKQLGRERPCRADFVGLEAADRYLFGYGMDYKNYLRNAAGIFACKST